MEVRVLEARKIQKELEIFPGDTSGHERWSGFGDRVELTKGALLGYDNPDGFVRLVFMAFDRLEEILQPEERGGGGGQLLSSSSSLSSTPNVNGKEDRESKLPPQLRKAGLENKENVTRILNSKVISASLGKGRHVQLSEPVRLYFRHLIVENVTNPKCVFWDYTAR